MIQLPGYVTTVRCIDKNIIAHREEKVNRFFGKLYLNFQIYILLFDHNATRDPSRVDFPTRRQ